ncbi:hypothetical protein BDV19DRAFT_383627 [Aspergillus venezuelensis]
MAFYGVQGLAIKAIQDGASLVVAIMPTSGGKSMLFMLPVYAAPGGYTIVVILLILLQANLIKYCHFFNKATIVLVTPKLTKNPNFYIFLNHQWFIQCHWNVAYQVFWPILPRRVPQELHQWLTTPVVLGFIHKQICQAYGGRVIIYTNIKSQVEAISQELGCKPYHSKVVNWARYMIYIGWLWILLDYGQESSQARQDRLASKAILYIEVVKGIRYRIVNKYTWQQYQDINPGKLPCNACNPN